ncbi:uncharacterized protein LOC111786898 [Cucurbita pepo subsp. pepo]|uniref:uncharacterized protein LOC111786898 n=1 Tax=Cucurbita pepo subsp. pepo TaxID=3664 RepID=UPI000C9D8A04|nr:uncharacterized protein LOC111786898 [Cucurbita pepo subsp. pepo]
MDVPSVELNCESEEDSYPLLMAQPENISSSEHIINITGTGDSAPSSLPHGRNSNGLNSSQPEDRPSSSTRVPSSQPSISTTGSNSRNSSFIRRGDSRRRRSPLNSGLWISIELLLTMSQIIAAIIVLSLSKNEKPRAPLFAWIVGYASGCGATLPLLYWRYRHRNQASEQDSLQPSQNSNRINVPAGPFSVSVSRASEGEELHHPAPSPRGSVGSGLLTARYWFFNACTSIKFNNWT